MWMLAAPAAAQHAQEQMAVAPGSRKLRYFSAGEADRVAALALASVIIRSDEGPGGGGCLFIDALPAGAGAQERAVYKTGLLATEAAAAGQGGGGVREWGGDAATVAAVKVGAVSARVGEFQRAGWEPIRVRTMRWLLDRQVEILEAAGANKEWRLPVEDVTFTVHSMGTARMGRNSRNSVMNKDHRCHDVSNLFPVDGSIFVTSGRQQPTATIQALAFRASEKMGEKAQNRDLGR